MLLPIKKIFFNIVFNSCLFLILIIGIQNSSIKKKVNFVFNESIEAKKNGTPLHKDSYGGYFIDHIIKNNKNTDHVSFTINHQRKVLESIGEPSLLIISNLTS